MQHETESTSPDLALSQPIQNQPLQNQPLKDQTQKDQPNRTFRRTFHAFFHWRRLRFAFGEVLMIAVGIHLAFGLDRIGDYYQQRELEQKTLVELRNGIERDRLDIALNIGGYEGRMESAALVSNYLENGRLPDKQFGKALNQLLSTTTFTPSNVPFETLKTRGLDTIRDEPLRAEVAEYYEVHRAVLLAVEGRYNAEQATFITPFVRKYLDIDGTAQPSFYMPMQQDRDFRRELIWLNRYSREMVKKYAAIEGRAEVLVKRINAVVAEL